LKSDWHVIRKDLSQIVKEDYYNQSFDNFEGDHPITFNFSHSVQCTTAEYYSQKQRFNISANADIPVSLVVTMVNWRRFVLIHRLKLGLGGAMAGFNASMSAEQIKNKSDSVVDNRERAHSLIVPAGEGRLVEEKTTVTSVATLYEAALRAEGTVGIVVDPAWYKPNDHYIIYNIEDAFPNAEATSRIARISISTATEQKISKMPKLAGVKPKVLKKRRPGIDSELFVPEKSQGRNLKQMCSKWLN
jgi:hypothetical protein